MSNLELTDIISESDVWWRVGAFIGLMPHGRLRLYKTGRVECVLDTGDIVFSCPAALMKFTEFSQAISFAVGPHVYNLQFFEQKMTNVFSGSFVKFLASNRDTTKVKEEWLAQLANAQINPADTEAIIAIFKNRNIHRIQRISLVAITLTVGFALTIGIGAGKLGTTLKADPYAYALPAFLIAIIGFPLIFKAINTYMKTAKQAMSQNHSRPNQVSILPTGTMATASPGTYSLKTLLVAFIAGGLLLYLFLYTLFLFA